MLKHARNKESKGVAQIQQSEPTEEIPPANTLLHARVVPARSNPSPMQAAELVGINYLTAKTILFFHKNNHKSYQFDLASPHPTSPAAIECPTACYCPLRKKNTVEEKMHYRKARI